MTSVKINTTVIGFDQLDKALKRLRDEMKGKEGNITANAARDVAKDVARRMMAFAPHSARGSHIDWHRSKTGKWVHGGENGERAPAGRLKRSIFYKREPRPRYLSELFLVGPRMGSSRNDPNGAWYAAIVEFRGGRGGRGQGFMRRSIDPGVHIPMFANSLAKRILTKAKKIGDQNSAEVAAAVKRETAKFAYKR